MFNEGDLIRAPFFDGIGEVKKFEERQGYFLLETVLKNNNQFKSFRLTKEQLNQVELISEEISFLQDSEDFFLLIEALRIRLAYQFDPLLAVNVSQIDPLPHQIEGVYDYALKSPRVRFLIADDAGAGKTKKASFQAGIAAAIALIITSVTLVVGSTPSPRYSPRDCSQS